MYFCQTEITGTAKRRKPLKITLRTRFMKRLTLSLLLLLLLGWNTLLADEAQKREMRTVWIATVSNIDWPGTRGTGATTIAKQKQQLLDLLDGFEAANMNAICLQTRPMADAFYKSSYEPWSSYLTGTRGRDPGWDPLEFAVEECHKRGLECHVWVNPYRFSNSGGRDCTTPQDEALKASGILMQVEGSDRIVFNPALEASRQRVVDVCREMIENYDIDGIIFDDYFYPSVTGGIPTDSSAPDWELYQASGTSLSIADWRRANVNLMVRNVYDMVQTTRPGVKFAIGPAGVAGTRSTSAARHGVDPCPTGSDWQYNGIYSDPLAWLEEGTIDYISPQLYWKTNHTTNPFGPLTQWWSYVANHFNRHHYASHNIYFMAGTNTQADWDEILQQIRYSRQYNLDNAPGVNFYSAKYISGPTCTGFGDYLSRTLFTHKALTPALTWKTPLLNGTPSGLTRNGNQLTWDGLELDHVRYAVYALPTDIAVDQTQSERFAGLKSDYLIKTCWATSLTLPDAYTSGYWYAVTAIDGWGNESQPAMLNAPAGEAQAVTLTSPIGGDTVTWQQTFAWTPVDNATYRIQIADDEAFSKIALEQRGITQPDITLDLNALKSTSTYYWRVITSQTGRFDKTSGHAAFSTPRRPVGETEPGYTVKQDIDTYAPVGNLTLTNRWIRSVKDEYANISFDSNGLMNRGFTPWNDRVLVVGRSSGSSDAAVFIEHYNAETGEHIKRVTVGNGAQCPYYPGNDIFLDSAGNVIITNLVLNIGSYPIRILQVDPETGEATLRASLMASGTATTRVDHCNVLGDVTSGRFVVMAAMSNASQIIRWVVENGTVTDVRVTTVNAFTPAKATNFGLAPRIWPVSETTAYVSGGSTYPTRYNLLTGQIDDAITSDMDIVPKGYGGNGLATFEMTGKRYMLFPCNDYESTTGFRYRLARSDGGNNFADFSTLWTFPEQGIGGLNSSTWSAPCYVADGKLDCQKSLYIYVPGNGFAAYTLSLDIKGDVNGDGLVDVSDLNALINVLLNPDAMPAAIRARADLNRDKSIDISDVNMIINIILGN